MISTRKELSRLFTSGIIPSEYIGQSLTLIGVSPNHSAWKTSISNLLLWLGALAIASSVLGLE